MNEFLSTLLQAVLIAAVPVCATFIGNGVSAFAKYIGARTDNDTAKKYLDAVEQAVKKAVTYTSQTYVDALKKSESFTKENQEEALNRAIEKATNLLTHEAILFLEDAYGDLTEYLKTNIEAEVRRQKQEDPAVLGLPLEAVESVREPDTAAIATATAAATAAATTAATAAVSQRVQTESYAPNVEVQAPAE